MYQTNFLVTNQYYCSRGQPLDSSDFKPFLKRLRFRIRFFHSSLLCRCSKAALKSGYTLFGITDHAHCWGFNGTESSLASLKESSGCVNASIMKPFCKESDKICAGAIRFIDVSSFIYLALGKNILFSFHVGHVCSLPVSYAFLHGNHFCMAKTRK